ncbi:MAG: hypothetical protein R3B70_09490 [Polyangiaceae bacterium]
MWVEASFELPAVPSRRAELSLVAVEGAFVDYHLWIVVPSAGQSAP